MEMGVSAGIGRDKILVLQQVRGTAECLPAVQDLKQDNLCVDCGKVKGINGTRITLEN